MAASESLRFDITASDRGSDAFSRFGRSVSDVSAKMDGATARSIFLDDALKRQAETAKRSTDATLALASSDKILDEVERRLADGALEAEFALKKEADAKKKSGDAALSAAAKNKTFADSLSKVADSAKKGGGPAWLGPALALAPAAGTLTGVAAGASAGLAGAAIAGGAALAAFGAVAKPVLADALKAEQAVQTAQDAYTLSVQKTTGQYQVAMTTAKTQAQRNAAYAAEQKGFAADRLAETQAISKAYIELSPQQIALSKQLGNMAQAWDNLKAAETPVVAGALQPWLKSVTDLTGKLSPIISAVAPVIGDLGTRVDGLVNSPEFAKFLNFVTGEGSAAVGAVGGTAIDFIDALVTLLPKFTPLINDTVNGIAHLGPAVLAWANSKKTADDITKFMAWFSANGPVVGGLLKNIGGALKALAPGLTAGGTTELKLLSDFFGWVAKLPPSVAKPLLDVTGALLILNKLGVFSVGVKFVGKAASWLTGGVVSIGSGASAAAEMQAAMAAGGASAAAEIRAAMAAGGTTAAAEAGAGEAAGGASAGTAVVAAETAAAPAIGTLIGLAVGAQIAGYLAEKQFSNLFSAGVAGASSAGGTGLKESAPLSAVLAGTGTNTTLHVNVVTDTKPLDALLKELGYTPYAIGLVNKLVVKPGSNVGDVDKLLYSLGANQSDILAVNKMIVKPKSDTSPVDALLKRIGVTPGQIAGVNKLIAKPGSNTASIDALLKQIGLTPPQIAAANRLILKPHSDTSPVTALQKAIDALHGKTVPLAVQMTGEGGLVASASSFATKTFNLTTLPGKAAGWRVPGYGGGDRWPVLVEGGEAIVPKEIVPPIAGYLGAHGVPGFTAGGRMADGGPWAAGQAASDAAAWAESDVLAWKKVALAAQAAAAAKAAYAPGSPAYGGSILKEQQFAASLFGGYGWSVPYEMPALISLWNQESGWNPYAANPTSNARGIPQNINGWSAYAPGDWANQIRWGESYIHGRYGDPLAAWAHEGAFNWYGNGLDAVIGKRTLIGVGDNGPEHVTVTPVGRGGGATGGVDVHYHVTVNVPPTVNPRDAGRQVADLLLAHTSSGGRLYPPGTVPR